MSSAWGGTAKVGTAVGAGKVGGSLGGPLQVSVDGGGMSLVLAGVVATAVAVAASAAAVG